MLRNAACWCVAGVGSVVLLASSSMGFADDPDPVELLKAADKALAGVASLRYDGVAEGIGSLAARSPRVTSAVRLERIEGEDALGWRFGAEGTVFAPGAACAARFAASYDGTTFRTLLDAEKQVVESEASQARAMLDHGAGWVLTWAARWDELVTKAFSGDEPAGQARYEGVMEVEGVRCHVVFADYSNLSDPRLYGAWWFLGEQDSLPRRVEMHYLDENFGDGFARLTLANLKADGAAAEGPSFTLAAPEGYEIKKHEPPRTQARRAQPRQPQPKVAVGQASPDWTLKDSTGKNIALADLKGKVVVLDFWATWCGPCRAAMPGVQRLHDKFKGRKVAVYGVNCWENADPVAFMKEQGLTYGLLLDGDEVAQAYGVGGIPAFFVIGPDGKIIHQASGFDPMGQAEKQIEKVIDEALRMGG